MSIYGYSDDEFINDDENVTLISKLDVSNPLHLHPNDFAALTIVSVKFKGTKNYHVWSNAMLLALEGRNKTGFIDGSCRRSNVDEVLGRQWDRVNAVVLGWILNFITEELFLVHTLEIEDGTMIHMLAERRYPLSRELMIRMLDHGMEVEEETETAITLIHLFILWTTEDGDNS
ncbi:ribonuclease H-like domain-containing protein [Tanacetum coccineum]